MQKYWHGFACEITYVYMHECGTTYMVIDYAERAWHLIASD